MGRRIDDATMDNVELLAKLTLEPEEREKVRGEMEQILNYVEKLNELDTEDVEPLYHVFPSENVFREDVVTNGDEKERMLANAPARKEDAWQVPKTVEQ